MWVSEWVRESVSNILFYVRGSSAYDDVDLEIDVSEANFFVSKASKLSAGARILGAW